jgi:hypothetical protein
MAQRSPVAGRVVLWEGWAAARAGNLRALRGSPRAPAGSKRAAWPDRPRRHLHGRVRAPRAPTRTQSGPMGASARAGADGGGGGTPAPRSASAFPAPAGGRAQARPIPHWTVAGASPMVWPTRSDNPTLPARNAGSRQGRRPVRQAHNAAASGPGTEENRRGRHRRLDARAGPRGRETVGPWWRKLRSMPHLRSAARPC